MQRSTRGLHTHRSTPGPCMHRSTPGLHTHRDTMAAHSSHTWRHQLAGLHKPAPLPSSSTGTPHRQPRGHHLALQARPSAPRRPPHLHSRGRARHAHMSTQARRRCTFVAPFAMRCAEEIRVAQGRCFQGGKGRAQALTIVLLRFDALAAAVLCRGCVNCDDLDVKCNSACGCWLLARFSKRLNS